jgi:NodT family efflux transporter outer membrane factor (OMF) lipoprotein
VFLTACLVGPNFKEPQKRVATQWLKNSPAIKDSRIENANWWNVFKDPTLTCLIQIGYENNYSLQIAAARVLQTRAQLAQSVGELYPQQQALMGNLTYNRIGGSSLQGLVPSNFWTAMLGASSSWELDFWGKYRRAIRSNDASFLASFAAYDNALVTLTSDIATAYINIRTTEESIRITKRNIAVQATGLQIAKARFNAGQTSLLDVQQAQTELSQTQSTLPKLVSDLQRFKDALAVLLGATPDKMDTLLAKKQGIPKAPPSVAVGIPREAMAKRPDILQARMEAVAQSELIGAAKANLFPSLSLAGTFAFSANTIGSNSLGELFNWSNHIVTAGPSFTWSILNYGQITNAVRAQDAAFQQALLKYQNAVLKAQQEVQDNITQFIESRKAENYLITANNSAIKATRLALIRYREGESDFTPVLNSERQQLQVQLSLTNTAGEIPKAVVALYRALGGGWQIRMCHDIVPNQMKAQMASRTNWGKLLQPQNHQPAITKSQHTKDLLYPTW